VALTVKDAAVVLVGVPEMTPVLEFSVRLEGRLPVAMA
jgi:hypothetical protein